MKRAGRVAGLVVLGILGAVLGSSRESQGQVRSISGILRSGATFTEQRVGASTTRESELRHDYSLGVQGLVVDPRLATFDVTGTFAGNDVIQGREGGARIVSGGLNLQVLPTSRIPLSLRHLQSYGWNGTTSNLMSSGLNWRVSHPLYPALSLNLERTAVKTSGLSPTQTEFMSGTLQATYRRESLDLFGEVGARRTADAIRETSTLSQFASFNGSYRPSEATTLQGGANYFQEGGRFSAGINASLIDRPGPTLTRNANASLRTSRDAGSSSYSLDAGGNVTKNYTLAPALQAFLTGNAAFAADIVGEAPRVAAGGTGGAGAQGFMSLTLTGGGGLTYSGFRYVVASGDANLTALYEDDRQQGVGVRGTGHLGLTGRNLGPLSLGGDYTIRVETGVVNARDQTFSFRGGLSGSVHPTLSVEAFAQAGLFLRQGGATGAGAGDHVSLTGGGRATYTGIPSLTWNAASQYRLARSGLFETQAVTHSTGLSYIPFGRFQASLTAHREDTLTTGEIRHAVQAEASYRIGVTTLSLTYGLDLLSGRGPSPLFQRVMFTWTRPFGRRLR